MEVVTSWQLFSKIQINSIISNKDYKYIRVLTENIFKNIEHYFFRHCILKRGHLHFSRKCSGRYFVSFHKKIVVLSI